MAALNPYAFQLYGPASSHPIQQATNRYTVAGVVTGYNKAVELPYWELLVHRHGSGNNRVHVKMDLQSPFAGLMFNAVEVASDVEDYRVNSPASVVAAVCTLQELNETPYDVTTLRVLPDCMQDEAMRLQINHFPELRVLEVGARSLTGVHTLELSDLPHLRSLVVGQGAFSAAAANTLPSQPDTPRSLLIQSNPELEVVVLQEGAFADYQSVSIKACDKLAALEIGTVSLDPAAFSINFFFASVFQLTGSFAPLASSLDLPSLVHLSFGNYAFASSPSVVLYNLPALQDLTFGIGSFGSALKQCSEEGPILLASPLLWRV